MSDIKKEGLGDLQLSVRQGRRAATQTKKQIIKTGQFFLTAGVSRAVANSTLFSRFVLGSYGRHKYQDWGDLGHHDKETNDYALEHGGRIISSYNIPKYLNIAESMKPQTKIWIITEGIERTYKADVRGTSERVNRTAGGSGIYTTVLFPSEY